MEKYYSDSINKSIKRRSVPYKTYKKYVKIFAATTALATILTCSLVTNISKDITEYQNSKVVSNGIVQMISPEKKYNDILDKYTYYVGTEGHYAYNTSALAEELVHVEPEYFDIVIFNIYTNMNYKSTNIDNLFININIQIKNVKETNPELYYKMKDVETFEDYLKKLKLVDQDGNISIEKYERYGNYLNELHKEAIKQDSKGMKR